jgi:hypothetical protein
MKTVQDLLKQKVTRRVTRSDKGRQHAKRGYKLDVENPQTQTPNAIFKNTKVVKNYNGK